MNCLDCYPDETPAVAVCGRCGAAICIEHLVVSDEQLTFTAPIIRPVVSTPPARKLRCSRCTAAETGQRERRSA